MGDCERSDGDEGEARDCKVGCGDDGAEEAGGARGAGEEEEGGCCVGEGVVGETLGFCC